MIGAAVALVASACGSVAGRKAAPAATTSATAPSLASGLAVSRPADAASLVGGRWSALPAAPIAPRQGASVAWTGKELIVWGGASGPHGGQLHADGAAYDPAKQTWHLLPPAPLSPRTGQAAAWTGHEMVVWGGYTRVGANASSVTGSGAAYDPATNRWQSLPSAPLSPRADALGVWSGNATTAAPALGRSYPRRPRSTIRRRTLGAGCRPTRWQATVSARRGRGQPCSLTTSRSGPGASMVR